MNSTLSLTPHELLARYQAGERNFAGIRFIEPNNDPEALCGANLSGIILRGAYLPAVKLREANLTGAKMRGVYMPDADLTLTDLREAELIGATLKRACLECADLKFANLEAANLTGANLDGSDLTQAKLAFSNLSQLDLSQLGFSSPFFEKTLDAFIVARALFWQTTLPNGQLESGPRYYEV